MLSAAVKNASQVIPMHWRPPEDDFGGSYNAFLLELLNGTAAATTLPASLRAPLPSSNNILGMTGSANGAPFRPVDSHYPSSSSSSLSSSQPPISSSALASLLASEGFHVGIAPPRWMEDNAADNCMSCGSAFSPLKRRHHCRQCGKLFCQNCSSHRIPLPLLGVSQPVRVCNDCSSVAALIVDALGFTENGVIASVVANSKLQTEAVSHLASMADRDTDLSRVVCQGGVLVFNKLCRSSDEEIQLQATAGLFQIVRRPTFRTWVAKSGSCRALLSLIGRSLSEDVLIQCLCALSLLYKHELIRRMLLQESFPHAALYLASTSRNNTTQSLAAKCISVICSHPEGQLFFINDKKGALRSLHSLLLSPNDVVQKYASKTAAYLSMHSEHARAKILHEDMAMGGALVSVLCGCTNLHTLSHCACAVANLASTLESQLLIPPEMIRSLCILVVDHPTVDEMQVHVARGLANFALFERNHDVLVDVLNNILLLLQSSSREVHRHVLRAIDNLLNKVTGPITRAKVCRLLLQSPLFIDCLRAASRVDDALLSNRAVKIASELLSLSSEGSLLGQDTFSQPVSILRQINSASTVVPTSSKSPSPKSPKESSSLAAHPSPSADRGLAKSSAPSLDPSLSAGSLDETMALPNNNDAASNEVPGSSSTEESSLAQDSHASFRQSPFADLPHPEQLRELVGASLSLARSASSSWSSTGNLSSAPPQTVSSAPLLSSSSLPSSGARKPTDHVRNLSGSASPLSSLALSSSGFVKTHSRSGSSGGTNSSSPVLSPSASGHIPSLLEEQDVLASLVALRAKYVEKIDRMLSQGFSETDAQVTKLRAKIEKLTLDILQERSNSSHGASRTKASK